MRVTPDLFNKNYSHFLNVREFEKVICLLYITGWSYSDGAPYYKPMESEIGCLETCNLYAFYDKEIMSHFPKTNMMSFRIVGGYVHDNHCCQGLQ